jgi:DNA-binding CsgD family transcriptional regulator
LEGGLEQAIDEARGALLLTDEIVDPIEYTGLLCIYSYSLALTCRYQESLKQSDLLLQVAETCGLDFPVPYAQLDRARALTGLGRFAPAARTLSMIERRVRDQPSSFFLANLPVARALLFASVGDLGRALDVLSPGPVEQSTRTERGEYLGWQALLHAAGGDPDRAQLLATDSRGESRALEARTLALLAEAIVAVGQNDTVVATARLDAVVESQVWDPVVIAVRATPALGPFLADQTRWRGWLQRLLAASADRSIANRLGLQVPRVAKRTAELTPRENEVHELLAQGLTNDEIARLLYISLSTTKVHVKHIYEKLGVRSRLEAARALRSDV